MNLIAENHHYAKRMSDEVEIHISAAVSGRGYVCLGCQREMQAVKHKLEKYTDYFRHDAKYIKLGDKCTFSDHQHRRGIAITSLLLEKRIKVPAIRLFNSFTIEDPPMVIEQARFVYAREAKANLKFYEGSDGVVRISERELAEDNFLLFAPDVVFFDRSGKPILMIEIVKAFKLNDAAKANLKRLKINTLQITLPKESREAIFNSLFQTGRSKWIYTNEQQHTRYVRPSTGTYGGDESVDDFERRIHEESVTCRVNQIANLIRAINKCFQSEQYLSIEQSLDGKLVDARRSIERNRQRRGEFEAKYRTELEDSFKQQFDAIAVRQRELQIEEGAFSTESYQLEERYLAEAGRIEREKSQLEPEESGLVETEQRLAVEEATIEQAIGRAERTVDERSGDLEREFAMYIDTESGNTDRARSNINELSVLNDDLQQKIESLSAEFKGFETDATAEYQKSLLAIEQEEAGLPEFFRKQGEGLERKFEDLRSGAVKTLERGDIGGSSGVAVGLKRLCDQRSRLADIERARRLLESIKKGTYKDWI